MLQAPEALYFDASSNFGYTSPSTQMRFYNELASQTSQLHYDTYNPEYPWITQTSASSWPSYPIYTQQYLPSNELAQAASSIEATPSLSSRSSHREASSTPSCASSMTGASTSYSPAAPRLSSVPRSRSRTPATATSASKRKRAQAQAKTQKTKSSTAFRDRNRSWPRHILVRAKILPNEPATELRYHMVVLRSADVQSCGTTICHKLGIESNGHKSMRWKEKTTGLQGPVDSIFLSELSDMQDFVVDIVGAGNNGYVELMLEMK